MNYLIYSGIAGHIKHANTKKGFHLRYDSVTGPTEAAPR